MRLGDIEEFNFTRERWDMMASYSTSFHIPQRHSVCFNAASILVSRLFHQNFHQNFHQKYQMKSNYQIIKLALRESVNR